MSPHPLMGSQCNVGLVEAHGTGEWGWEEAENSPAAFLAEEISKKKKKADLGIINFIGLFKL